MDLYSTRVDSTESDVESHLEMGRNFVARGQLQDALSHYHAAIEGDQNNYLTYFKRATVYLALPKAKFALLDFDKVLELKPDFHAARFQRGLLLMKQAEIERAKEDLYHVYLSGSEISQEAYDHYARLDSLRNEIDSAYYYFERGDHESTVQLLNGVVEACPWSHILRELRSQAYFHLGDSQSAIADLKTTTKLLPDHTEGYLRLAHLYYNMGMLTDALREVRECLKLDPEHKKCFPFYKKIKKIEKLMADAEKGVEEKNYGVCVEKAEKALQVEENETMVVFAVKKKLCHCMLHNDQLTQSLKYCKEALQLNEDADVHCDKADALIATEMYQDAIYEFNKAIELDSENQRAHNGLKRAKKLQKQSEKRDYYKILNVKRTATKKEIIKAYRKAAQKWHPDNFHGDEKKIAEKKFIDIAAAKEVLTDPEKKQKFDNGEDPLDPESGNQNGFNGFQGFHSFHGSPFQFKFHFN